MKKVAIDFPQIYRLSWRSILAFFLFTFITNSSVSAGTFAAGGDEVMKSQVTQDSKQQTAVKGQVHDENGEPLIGVSIKVKGTTTGTVTDVDGGFSIRVPNANATLTFSFLGFVAQDVVVGNSTDLKIVMKEDAQALGEVVVTALGMKRYQKSLGYSMTELKGENLLTNNINPVGALQGKVAGVQIESSDGGMFGSMKVQLRGASTLKGNNQPIFVIDGIILDNSLAKSGDADWDQSAGDYGNELKNLNPDDFESVSILKGAAATALYGSRGMKGAVIITTKSGKKKQGLGINVSQTFGVDHVFKQPRMQNIWGSGQASGWVDYGEKDASGNYYAWDNQNQFFLVNGQPKVETGSGLSFGPRFDGREIISYDNTTKPYSAQKNNFKDLYDVGFNTNTNIAIQGGNDKTTFYTSLSYKNAKGVLPNNTFERLSFLAKASHQITSKVSLSASMSFANSTPKNPLQNVGENFINATFTREYDPSYFKTRYLGDNHSGLAQSSLDKYGEVPGRSLWFSLYNDIRFQKETSVRPTLELNVDLLNWLKFKAEGSYNYYFIRKENKIMGTEYAKGGGGYLMGQYQKEQTNLASTFTLNKNYGDWDFGGFVRGEYYNNYVQNMEIETEGGLIVPGQFFIQNSKKTPKYSEVGKLGSKRILSVAGQFSAAWKNQVFMDVTARNDWSSSLVYSNKLGNYSYFYPSISGSWLMNETFKLPSWVNLAKLRASWAQVGNDTDPYMVNFGYDLNSSMFGDKWVYSLGIPDLAVEPNLKPERKNAWEVGLDWRFFDSRVNVDFAYYKENTKNQIMIIDVPHQSGIKQQLINAGNIQNQGIELTLNTVPFRNKDWEVTADFTYTRNRNKIISLHENVADFIKLEGSPDYGNFRIGSVAMQNGDYGILMTDSKPKIDEATGKEVLTWDKDLRYGYALRSGKMEQIGSLVPDFLGSFAAGVKWKGLSLNVSLDARFGGYVASYGSKYGTSYGFTEASLKNSAPEYGGMTWTSKFDGKTYHDGMIPDGIFAENTTVNTHDGKTVDVSGMTYQQAYDAGYVEPTHASIWTFRRNSWSRGVVNEDWVKELSYIALREISLKYQVPNSIASKMKAKSLSLMLTGRNLGYLYNTMPNGENPESIRGTNSGEFRVRSFSPYTANYMFTINVGF